MNRERGSGLRTATLALGCGLVVALAACTSTVVTEGPGGAGGEGAAGVAATSAASPVTATQSGSAVSNGSSANGTTGAGTTSSSTGGLPDCSNGACLGTDPQGDCDAALAIDSADAIDGARAIGLCQMAAAGSWGVSSAEWVRADGSPLGMGDGGQNGDGDLQLGKGILGGFGPNVHPLDGTKLLALSTGSARQPSDGASYKNVSGYWKDNAEHTAPAGYPKTTATCPGVTPGATYDSAGLRVVVHTPADAKSLHYALDFYTYEFPNFVCSQYDDVFVAIMDPKPPALADGNLSFDSVGDLLSPHTSLLRVCEPATAGGIIFSCPLGTSQLSGTGYDQPNSSAATGWLVTTAPLPDPGSDISLLFTIWDSGDGVQESTILIDDFRFELTDATTATNPM